MDWKRCIICQKTTGKSVQCPANSKRKDAGAGYVSFIRNTQEFKKLGIDVISCELPLDENEAFEQTLLHKKASWHKSCRDLYNSTKLEHAKKRKLAEAAAEEIIDETEEEIPSSPVKARQSSVERYNPQRQCFFCDEYDSPGNLHSASTLDVDKKVRDCAALLNERKLIAKLSVGDLIAIEAKYHAKYLVALYNQARPFKQKASKPADDTSVQLDELAFAELFAYIEECLEVEEPAVLTLSDLVRFYTSKVQGLGAECGKVNATRLKERVQAAFPDLTAHAEGREIQLVPQHFILLDFYFT